MAKIVFKLIAAFAVAVAIATVQSRPVKRQAETDLQYIGIAALISSQSSEVNTSLSIEDRK